MLIGRTLPIVLLILIHVFFKLNNNKKYVFLTMATIRDSMYPHTHNLSCIDLIAINHFFFFGLCNAYLKDEQPGDF